jgi:hypothetical protein
VITDDCAVVSAMPSMSNSLCIEADYFLATAIDPSQLSLSISSGRTAIIALTDMGENSDS